MTAALLRAAGMAAQQGARRHRTGDYPIPATLTIAGYEARDATVDANGDIVTIPDLLGVNTITSVGGLTLRADLAADTGVGGQLVAVFGGSANHRITRASWAGGSVAQPYTRIVVAKGTAGLSDMIIAGGDAPEPNLLYTATQYRAAAGATLIAAVVPDSNWHAYAVVFDGASSAIYRDNFVTPIQTGNAGALGFNGTSLGANQTGANPLDGSIFGSYDCGGALTAAQLKKWAQYITQETALAVVT